jgi:tetratricopeptide (TPR) repeat protein
VTLSPTTALRLLVITAACSCIVPATSAQDAADDEIRPFDRIVLKNGKSLYGVIESGGEGAPETSIRLDNGGRTKLLADDIQEIVPRQTAEEVYKRKVREASAVKDPKARAAKELALGKWAKTPHPSLDGKPPREEDALRHFLNAVELEKTLTEAYPHILALLDSREGGEDSTGPDLEVKVALLAREGGYDDPEIDLRLGALLAGPLGLPERAIPHLEKVMTAKGNQGQARKARALLAEIHESRGALDKALKVYETALVSPETDPANFEPLYELARLRARSDEPGALKSARELFAKAQAIQPDYIEIPAEMAALDYREAALAAAEKTLKGVLAKDPGRVASAVDLALVQLRLGRFAPVEKALKDLVARAAGPEKARAHIGLGILRENRGDSKGALDEYQAALAADPDSTEVKVALALSLVQLSRAEEGRKIARDLLAAGREDRWLFAACSRVLGEAELSEGHDAAALAHFGRAVEVDERDAPLLERTGVLLLRAGKPDLGFEFLRRAREAGGDRPDTLNAMACYHYGRGDMVEAKKLFDMVLKLVPAPSKPRAGAAAPPLPAARAYALRGIDLIADVKRLQVFTADLKGSDGPSLNGWQEVERYGVEITRTGGMIVFAGKQSGTADGVTTAMLDRMIDATSFDRVSMTARVDGGKVRIGLRLEGVSAKGGASAGLVFYKDLDGVVRTQVKTTQGDWETPAITDGEPIDSGKPGSAGPRPWSDGAGFHTLEIRRSRRAAAKTGGGFDLYLDGEMVFWNIRVAGLTGKTYTVGLSCQTDEVGNDISSSVKEFKIYREVSARKQSANY